MCIRDSTGAVHRAEGFQRVDIADGVTGLHGSCLLYTSTDSQGRTVDFKNTVIILTSNLGSDIILNDLEPVSYTHLDVYKRQVHIGEVQASVWDEATREACAKAGIPLL